MNFRVVRFGALHEVMASVPMANLPYFLNLYRLVFLTIYYVTKWAEDPFSGAFTTTRNKGLSMKEPPGSKLHTEYLKIATFLRLSHALLPLAKPSSLTSSTFVGSLPLCPSFSLILRA